jgi:hypothetical protein
MIKLNVNGNDKISVHLPNDASDELQSKAHEFLWSIQPGAGELNEPEKYWIGLSEETASDLWKILHALLHDDRIFQSADDSPLSKAELALYETLTKSLTLRGSLGEVTISEVSDPGSVIMGPVTIEAKVRAIHETARRVGGLCCYRTLIDAEDINGCLVENLPAPPNCKIGDFVRVTVSQTGSTEAWRAIGS